MRFSFFKSKKDVLGNRIRRTIYASFGCKPKDIALYKLALCHKSHSRKGKIKNNERLEFLGDAVVDLAIADYLYQQFPGKKEGELTKMRARLVSRKNLIDLAENLSVGKEIPVRKQFDLPRETIIGNTLEAIFGAMYYDHGYIKTKEIIIDVYKKYLDLDHLIQNNADYKSMLQEWTQKRKKIVIYKCQEINGDQSLPVFEARVFIDSSLFGIGRGKSKKLAEKMAAEIAWNKVDSR